MKSFNWLLMSGITCAVGALAVDAWVWLAPFAHGDEPRIAGALIVASNAILGSAVCTELVRRRQGLVAPAFWILLLLTLAAAVLTWACWRLIV